MAGAANLKNDVDEILKLIKKDGPFLAEHENAFLIQGLKARGWEKAFFDGIPGSFIFDAVPDGQSAGRMIDYGEIIKDARECWNDEAVSVEEAKELHFRARGMQTLLETLDYANSRSRGSPDASKLFTAVKFQHRSGPGGFLKTYGVMKANPPQGGGSGRIVYGFRMRLLEHVLECYRQEAANGGFIDFQAAKFPVDGAEVSSACGWLENKYSDAKKSSGGRRKEEIIKKLHKDHIKSDESRAYLDNNRDAVNAICGGHYRKEMPPDAGAAFQEIAHGLFFGRKPRRGAFGTIEKWEAFSKNDGPPQIQI